MRIRRFSSAAEKLLSLIPGDVGRPIAYLRNVMSAREVEQLASEAISSVSPREQRVRCIDSSWYSMKLVPYVTADHMIRGLVIEFEKTTPPSAASDSEPLSLLAQHVLSTLPQPMFLVDRQLHLVWANRVFFESFTVGPGALGLPLSEAWGSKNDPPELWGFVEELFSEKEARDVLIEHPFGRSSDRPMRFSGRLIPLDTDNRHPMAAVFMQEV